METMNFESLKRRIKNNFSPRDLMLSHAGEYLLDRMLQHADLQEKFGSLNRPENAERFKKLVDECIDRTDVRCYKNLLEFADKMSISLPKWLYGKCSIDLGDDGWVISSAT